VSPTYSQQEKLQQSGMAGRHFWLWEQHSQVRIPTEFGLKMRNATIAIWGLLVLYGMVHFSRGIYRVHRLHREASPLPLAAHSSLPTWFDSAPHRITLLESATINVPVTVGLFRPVVVLPSDLMPGLRQQDLSVVIAHEYAHIRRRDFLVHILCEFFTLPVFWHPGIRYLMSKISYTRELACYEYAAVQVGKRQLYAQTLLRVASLCLHAPNGDAMGLSIFDGDNLEVRIMRLTEKRSPLSRIALFGLVFAASLIFGSGAIFPRSPRRSRKPTPKQMMAARRGCLAKKRKGGIPCGTPPSLSVFSKIWFGFQITT
jgi:beta-lactamase regulating signal transducer with metallopeptidase domain